MVNKPLFVLIHLHAVLPGLTVKQHVEESKGFYKQEEPECTMWKPVQRGFLFVLWEFSLYALNECRNSEISE